LAYYIIQHYLYPHLVGIGVVIIGILILLSALIGYKKEK
jgi:uncharacterized membrane protein